MSAVGFHIGNENSYIAVVKSGGIEVLDDECNSRFVPTYIAFGENTRDIGVAAKNKVVTNLDNTVFGLKQILGKKQDDFDLEKELAYLPHEFCKLPSSDIGIKVSYLKNDVIFSTEQLMAMMFNKLKMSSEAKLGYGIRDCVISVPAYYTDSQRRAMLNSVHISGLNPLKLINESAAVALVYGFFKQNLSEEPHNVIFVDFGNSVLTVTACAFTKNKVRTLGCVWDFIGGRDFDNKLAEHFVEEFKVKYQLDVRTSKKALMSLVLECERLKKLMSTCSREMKFQIECIMQNKDVDGRIKREIFENLSVDIFKRVENTLRKILEETQLSSEQIHSVEIIGGSSRIPAVKQLIGKVFGREPNSTLNQDEAIVRGCALQCALLSPLLKTRNFVVEDIPSYVIKIAWKNVENQIEELEVFSFSDKIPSSKGITITMKKPFNLEARCVDLHGNFHKIGTFTFEKLPKDVEFGEVIRLRITARLNLHGIFSLTDAKMIDKSVLKQDDVNKSEEESESPMKSEDDVSDQVVPKENSLVKLYEVVINSDVPGLSEMQLNEYISAEQRMVATDIEEKEKANARNTLEEYVYKVRGKLKLELHDFVEEENRELLFDYLCDIENWLYDCEGQNAAEYTRRLKEIKIHIEPIFERYYAWEQKSHLVDEYRRILQTASDAINHLSSTENAKEFLNDVEDLREMHQSSKSYQDQCVESFSKMNKHDDVTDAVEDFKKSLINFKNDFQKLFSDVTRKISSAKEAHPASSGDGISSDSKCQGTDPEISKESEFNSDEKVESNVQSQNMSYD